MRSKKTTGSTGLSFTVSGDFSRRTTTEAARIVLPGDDVLAAVTIAAKALVQRGNLIIENVPLEPWATQSLQLLRKMGLTPGIEETGTTTFGAVGNLQLQRFERIGRKIDCVPLYQFSRQLPSMVVVGAFAKGQSVFRQLGDLRDDTPDGIEEILTCLRAMGVHHGEMPDGIILKGANQYDGFDLSQSLPPATSAAFAVAGLVCIGKSTVCDEGLCGRFPDFAALLDSIGEFR